jgi:hypothetical protein
MPPSHTAQTSRSHYWPPGHYSEEDSVHTHDQMNATFPPHYSTVGAELIPTLRSPHREEWKNPARRGATTAAARVSPGPTTGRDT